MGTPVMNTGKIVPDPILPSRKITPPVSPSSSKKLVKTTSCIENVIRPGNMSPLSRMTSQSSSAPTRLVRGPVSVGNLADTMGTRLLPRYPSPPAPRSRVELFQPEFDGKVLQVDKEQVENLGKMGEVEQMQGEMEVVDLTQEMKQENTETELSPGIDEVEAGASDRINMEIEVNNEQLVKLRELGFVLTNKFTR